MPFPVLQQYLGRLPGMDGVDARIWTDAEGRAVGRFFHSTLTSVFQPIRSLQDRQTAGYEGFARSHADNDAGLSLWRLLDQAASDDESVALDRLCRMLHAINFFRQEAAAGADLYLNVHARLLAAVDSNHGMAFSRVLKLLGLPRERIVLQLPAVGGHPGWLPAYVADNYRRNGFRLALHAADLSDAALQAEKLRPEAIKLDARCLLQPATAGTALLDLLQQCAGLGIRLIVTRLDTEDAAGRLIPAMDAAGIVFFAQGYFFARPHSVLTTSPLPRAATG